MSRSVRPIVMAALALAAAPDLPAQTQRALTKPDAEFPEPATRISTIRELRDGRVVAVDSRENWLRILDFRDGSAKPLGRTGSGPGEYGFPGPLVALPGDTTVMHDPRNARFLLILPDGTLGETFRLSDPVAVYLGSRGSSPRGSDAQGNLYFEATPFTATGALDSAPLMRYSRSTAKLDTLAWLQLAKGNVTVKPGPNGTGQSITVGAQAFPAQDNWTALPGGGIAVVRVRDYHVDRYSPSRAPVAGAPVRTPPIAVDEAEKAAWRAERRSRLVPRNGGSVAPTLPEPEWPLVMPPFVLFSTFAQPNGDVWVLRSHKVGAPDTYDVFGPTGALTTRVTLPARARLVGFGNGTVYLVRQDDDDLEHLQRYRWQ